MAEFQNSKISHQNDYESLIRSVVIMATEHPPFLVVLFPGRCSWNCLTTRGNAFHVSLSPLPPWSQSEFRHSSERTQNPERGS